MLGLLEVLVFVRVLFIIFKLGYALSFIISTVIPAVLTVLTVASVSPSSLRTL